MKTTDFTHLHVHTHHSVLDGYGKLEELVKETATLGQTAVAMTDHSSLSGAYDFNGLATAAGVKPIIGMEAHVAPGGTSRRDRTPVPGYSGAGKYAHLTVLAKNSIGVCNLYRLAAIGHSEGFYGKPRIDLESLEEHRDGLIVLSGCAGSTLSTLLLEGHRKEAELYVDRMKSVFNDDFYVEVMDHGIREDRLNEVRLNGDLFDIAVKFRVPVVPTNDSHYVYAKDAQFQDAMLALQTNAKIAQKNRMRFSGSGYHLKSRLEMGELWADDLLNNTLRVAEKIESYNNFDHVLRMPRYSDDEDYDLAHNCWISRRMHPEDQAYEDRLDYELSVIKRMGFAGYFLTLADIVRMWKEAGIHIGPGRGSAGGSLVAYTLGITDLNPIAHGLLFERFLNPDRVSLPDIDLDVPQERRDEAIQMVAHEYGEDFVAHLGTFGIIKARKAIQDAAMVLSKPVRVATELKKLLPPPKFGRTEDLNEADFTEADDLITLEEGEFHASTEDEVIKLAFGLEGRIRTEGVHASGVVVSPQTLHGLIPLRKKTGEGGKGLWVTQFTMKAIEKLGFVKYDFLGLRNLDIIDETLRKLGLSWDDLPLNPEECNDAKTYQLLQSGSTFGVFQLDSPGMQQLLREVRPTAFQDISAVLSLYRPGPMGVNSHRSYARRKNGREASRPIHEELGSLEEVLGSTYGLIVYQEQVMKIAQEVAGFSLAEADTLRRAMGKKNHEELDAAYIPFREGMAERGYSEACTQALWEVLVPFADYSFNRAHAAGYALLAYWTAFLKANHPEEYMSAVLSSVSDNDKLGTYLTEVRRMGLSIEPPDINLSEETFTPSVGKIYYGLASIKGIGEGAVRKVKEGRPYRSIDDVIRRSGLNTGALACAVRAGCLDSLDSRRELVSDSVVRLAGIINRQKAAGFGQGMLWKAELLPETTVPIDVSLRREWEQELMAVSLTTEREVLIADDWLTEDELVWIDTNLKPSENETILKIRKTEINLGRVHLPRLPKFLRKEDRNG